MSGASLLEKEANTSRQEATKEILEEGPPMDESYTAPEASLPTIGSTTDKALPVKPEQIVLGARSVRHSGWYLAWLLLTVPLIVITSFFFYPRYHSGPAPQAALAHHEEPLPDDFAFIDPALNIRYVPPAKMYNLTKRDVKGSEDVAIESGATKFSRLLFLTSSLGDPDRYNVVVESMPRWEVSETNDTAACQSFARLLVGYREVGKGSEVKFGDFRFFVSTFESPAGQATRHVRVYTTIRNEQLLAFVFSASSSKSLDEITNSMRTISTAH
jgi:hypothetical protein